MLPWIMDSGYHSSLVKDTFKKYSSTDTDAYFQKVFKINI